VNRHGASGGVSLLGTATAMGSQFGSDANPFPTSTESVPHKVTWAPSFGNLGQQSSPARAISVAQPPSRSDPTSPASSLGDAVTRKFSPGARS
jgi:hypothetical protein